MKNNEEIDDTDLSEFVRKYKWMVRPCVDYENEVSECTCIKGRFHQYFIYGELLNCSKWIQDLKNCDKCLAEKNNEACKAIIQNEAERRMKRLSGAEQNDVWKKRDKPPENWNPPLSEYWLKKHENSLFHIKKDEYKKHVSTHEPVSSRFCTFL